MFTSDPESHAMFIRPQWQIEDLPDGTYHLKSIGSPVSAFGGSIFAVLMSTETDALQWRLVRVPEKGPDVFLCVRPHFLTACIRRR
jgi:hypothetical protein